MLLGMDFSIWRKKRSALGRFSELSQSRKHEKWKIRSDFAEDMFSNDGNALDGRFVYRRGLNLQTLLDIDPKIAICVAMSGAMV